MILDASYHIENDSPVIDLFRKTTDGIEVEKISDVAPYFYAEIYEGRYDDFMHDLALYPQVVDVEKVEKKGVDGELYKIFTGIPGDVPKIREPIGELDSVKTVYEADILFVHRCFIDKGWMPLDGDTKELNIAALDLEIYTTGAFPDSKKDPIIIASYADSKGLRTIVTSKQTKFNPSEIVRNEEEIIKFIDAIIKQRQPDIIVGYNSDNFDFPYIIKRAERYGIQLTWGFRGAPVKLDEFAGRTRCPIKGRPHIDLYPLCRMAFNLPRYTLEDVFQHITKREKLDLEHEEMVAAWKEGSASFDRFCDYACQDADATLEIAQAILPMYYELSRILQLPLQDVSRMTSAQRVEQLLILETTKNGYIIPNKPPREQRESRANGDYEGAFVQDPEPGLHAHVACVDYTSLYPSIIITHNIDPYRVNCTCCEGSAPRSPSNHWFCLRKTGFISGIEKSLIERRKKVKRAMAKESGQKKLMLDSEQGALKVLANAMYGYLGYPGARWYKKDCAESVTAFGRKYMSDMIQHATDHDLKVIYGDTDSAYIELLSKAEVGDKLEPWLRKYNKTIPEDMDLKFEGYFPRGIFITKKRYALLTEDDKLYIKGLETKRRDWAKIAKDGQRKVLDMVLKESDPKGAASFVLEEVQRLKEGDVPIDELVVHTQLTRSLKEFTGNPTPHIEAMKKAMKDGHRYEVGDILQYVITNNGTSISDQARLISQVKAGDYDSDYYINNQFIPAVSRIMYALGYDKEELLGHGKQMKIGDW